MPGKLLQVNFKLNMTGPEYHAAANELAGAFAEVNGLRWKVWILNEAENEAGGIYLFEDGTALQNFLDGPLAAQVTAHPGFLDLSAKPFDIMDQPTATCRGPV